MQTPFAFFLVMTLLNASEPDIPLSSFAAPESVPAKTVVLTFDDAVRSHLDFVAPLLKEYGFGATFFISAAWLDDKEHFLTWEEIAKLHGMGFELGNHTWTHGSFNTLELAKTLPDELARIDAALAAVGVPKPVTFAWPGNAFGPESLEVLRKAGYQFARRGMQPEQPYGEMRIGPAYDPAKHDPLLVPTTADAYPQWTMEHFQKAIAQARDGKVAILQFHGVPDIAHPWVHTPPEAFAAYMKVLKDDGYTVLAMRDLRRFAQPGSIPDDPVKTVRYPEIPELKTEQPKS